MLTKLNHFFINRQELYLGAKHDAGAPRTMARALLGAALLSLCGASKEFGLYDAEGTPGAGWALASAADLMTHRVAFVAQYNMLGLKIIKDFHSGNCCVATAGGLKLEIPGTPHGFQFLADAANGELQCNPSEGYPAGMAYKFMNQQTISSAAFHSGLDPELSAAQAHFNALSIESYVPHDELDAFAGRAQEACKAHCATTCVGGVSCRVKRDTAGYC